MKMKNSKGGKGGKKVEVASKNGSSVKPYGVGKNEAQVMLEKDPTLEANPLGKVSVLTFGSPDFNLCNLAK